MIFPQMTLTGYSLNMDSTAEDVNQTDTMAAFSKLVNEFYLNIVSVCCLKNGSNSKAQNVLCHAKSKGESEAIYAKLHPFSFAGVIKLRELMEVNAHVNN